MPSPKKSLPKLSKTRTINCYQRSLVKIHRPFKNDFINNIYMIIIDIDIIDKKMSISLF